MMKSTHRARVLTVVSLAGGGHRTIVLTEEHIRTELGVEPPREGALVDDRRFVALVLARLDGPAGAEKKSSDPRAGEHT